MKQILFFRPQDIIKLDIDNGSIQSDVERTFEVTFFLEEKMAFVDLATNIDVKSLKSLISNEHGSKIFTYIGNGNVYSVSKKGILDLTSEGWKLNEKIEVEFSEPAQVLNPELKLTPEVKLEPEVFPKAKAIEQKPKKQNIAQAAPINTDMAYKSANSRFWIVTFIIAFVFIDSLVIAKLKTNPGFEQFILLLIFTAQCWFFLRSFKDIDFLGNLFLIDVDRVFMKDGYLMIEKADNLSYSKVHLKIIERLNKYLKNNAGASNDYGILKQIVELEVNSANEKAQSLLSFPLYLGLAGTFLGIILGLSSFSSKSSSMFGTSAAIPLDTVKYQQSNSDSIGEMTSYDDSITGIDKNLKNDEKSENATDAVNELLGGVSIAMIGSLFGLVMTFVGQWSYSRAQSKNESDLNAYLSFIQVELLPRAQHNADEAYRTLAQNLSSFNTGLEKNLLKLENTLAGMDNKFISVLEEAKEATAREIELVNSIKEIDLKQVASIANKNISLANIQNEYISQIQDTKSALVLLNNNSSSVADMLSKFRDFYDSQFEQNKSLETVQAFVNHLGIITEKLEELTGGGNTRFHGMLDKMNRIVDEAEEHTDRYLKDRMQILEKLFNNTNIQFEQYVSPGEAKTTFENINQIPAAVESLTKSTNELRQQLPQLISRFTDAEKAFRDREMKQSMHLDQTLNEIMSLGKALKQSVDNLDPVIQVIMKASEPSIFEKLNPFRKSKNG